MEAVLADQYTQEVVYEYAYACHILDKRKTSSIMRELTGHLPFPQWLHLKRVKSDKNNAGQLSVLLAPCPEGAPPQGPPPFSPRELCPALDLPPGDSLGPPFVVRVPKYPPVTRTQFNLCAEAWPTHFHEDKEIARLLEGKILDKEEMARARSYMAEAYRAADKCTDTLERSSGCSNGACVVDPATNSILATASCVTKQHPLHHAVMVAIDLVARQQGGGVYQYPEDLHHVGPLTAGPDALDDKTGPYLCTGYDLYADTEPCVLCAMSLVHSRARRVFYHRPSPDGALGSKYKLHVQTGLNHHYEVYRGLEPCS